MAFSAATSARPAAMAEINVTPLVDVMLVLLIIFMIAAPVLTRTVPLELPQPGPKPETTSVDPVRVRIGPDGQASWSGGVLSPAMLQALLRAESARNPQPTLEIESHPDSRYEAMTSVLASARNAGFLRIGVVETP